MHIIHKILIELSLGTTGYIISIQGQKSTHLISSVGNIALKINYTVTEYVTSASNQYFMSIFHISPFSCLTTLFNTPEFNLRHQYLWWRWRLVTSDQAELSIRPKPENLCTTAMEYNPYVSKGTNNSILRILLFFILLIWVVAEGFKVSFKKCWRIQQKRCWRIQSIL